MPKSICFVGGGLAGGGQERALTNLANEFAERGYFITIICLFKTEIFFSLHPSIKVIWPSIDRKANNKFVYALKLVPFIRKSILKINPDTIVSFGDWFNAYVLMATRFLGKPVYITNRMGPNLYFGKFLEFFNKRLYPKSKALIVQTQRAKEIMQTKYNLHDVRVISNAVKPVEVENRGREKSMITVGRLSKEKGHDILIEAFAKTENIEWTLDIVGDGPLMESLKQLVKILKIEEKVIFHGHQKDFRNLLSKASIFVLPSYYEGFPNALVEAMSVPLACVASNCVAGPAEIISNAENGYLFETGNVEELAETLQYLMNNSSVIEKIENKALEVTNTYNFKKISDQFLEEIFR